jgi:hypothetical protein
LSEDFHLIVELASLLALGNRTNYYAATFGLDAFYDLFQACTLCGILDFCRNIDFILKWDENKEYDRLGLKEETTSILDVQVPYQIMPGRPGRNLAIIVEVAARNHSLKRMGYSAARELDRRLNAMIAQNSGDAE